MRHVDTLSTIIQAHFPIYITYKIIVCGEKNVQIGTILSRKSSKDPSWLAMCNVYFRNELPTGLPARLMPFGMRVASCRYELLVIFTCRLCIYIAMSNWHVVSFCEYSDNRYVWQSIIALVLIPKPWTFQNPLTQILFSNPKITVLKVCVIDTC